MGGKISKYFYKYNYYERKYNRKVQLEDVLKFVSIISYYYYGHQV